MQTHVSAAKAGVDALSTGLAIELGPRGLTSNVIAPGAIAETEGMERLIRKGDVAAWEREIPSGRYGTVKEIADATVFLFSDAGNYVNGEVLVGEFVSCLQGHRILLMANGFPVDGGGWHRQGATRGFMYPGFLLADKAVTGVRAAREAKL
jgi:peroxisomal 2,4-dienoyl-CoA reductase